MSAPAVEQAKAEQEPAPRPLGLYVHVPFCASTCDFCAFYQKQPTADDVSRFLLGVEAEAAMVMAGYEQRNRLAAPLVRMVLSRLAGWRYDGSDAARRRLVRALPLVAFRPADESTTG